AGSAPATAAAVPAASPAAAAPRDTRPLRVGTWNLRSFGRLPGKDMTRIAGAIDAHFDLLALTEVSGDGGPAALTRLQVPLGLGWALMLSPLPHPPASQPGSEYTAILYRRDRVRPCDGWERLRELPSTPAILHPPAVGCFTSAPPGQAGSDFLFAAYHATGADGDAGAVAQEVAQLDAVFDAMAAARPGEQTLIIAGDFNLEPQELATVSHASAPSDGSGSVLDLLGTRTTRRTDHLLLRDANATAALLGVATPIDLRGESPTDYYRGVSDHQPIVLELRVDESDSD
ncbi:MAG: endonuclease/exonuclease/phosphatase family protein, partial [Deltaproteobacteria bacterium]|nr:endonuclease/exonuclease/phosphatase family protein [Deltaproteobacteria bacterium]